MNMTTMLLVLSLGALVIFWYSQRKFKDKVLCIMHTQQGMRIEIWAPLTARHIQFGNVKKGDAGIYYLIPKYSTNTWWNKGVNTFFPALVKTWEFWWYAPFPQDPMAIQRWDPRGQCRQCGRRGALVPAITWHTPEVRKAAWQEQQYRAFAEATNQQVSGTGKMSNLWKFSILAALGCGIIAIGIIYQSGLLAM